MTGHLNDGFSISKPADHGCPVSIGRRVYDKVVMRHQKPKVWDGVFGSKGCLQVFGDVLDQGIVGLVGDNSVRFGPIFDSVEKLLFGHGPLDIVGLNIVYCDVNGCARIHRFWHTDFQVFQARFDIWKLLGILKWAFEKNVFHDGRGTVRKRHLFLLRFPGHFTKLRSIENLAKTKFFATIDKLDVVLNGLGRSGHGKKQLLAQSALQTNADVIVLNEKLSHSFDDWMIAKFIGLLKNGFHKSLDILVFLDSRNVNIRMLASAARQSLHHRFFVSFWEVQNCVRAQHILNAHQLIVLGCPRGMTEVDILCGVSSTFGNAHLNGIGVGRHIDRQIRIEDLNVVFEKQEWRIIQMLWKNGCIGVIQAFGILVGARFLMFNFLKSQMT